MEKNKLMLGALGVALLMGALLIGGSITGMATGDYTKPICSTNSECANGDVCCLFFEQESGVCNAQSMCEQITWLTKEGATIESVPAGDNPNEENYLVGIIVGALIVVIAGYAIMAPGSMTKEQINN